MAGDVCYETGSTQDVRIFCTESIYLKKASGKRRLPSDTPDDYLKTTEKALSEHAPAARNLNDQFVHALYSAESVSPEIVKQLRDSTDELAKEIRSNGKAGSPK